MERIWRHRWRRVRNWAIGILGPTLLRAWVRTLRIRWIGPGLIQPHPRGRENVIYVFWHQRMLPFAATHRGLGIRALISSHGDGEMLTRAAEGLGHKAIRGSTTRGGTRAMRGLLAEIGSGRDFVITPDGPRGPRHVFQVGSVFFASRSGLAVVPASASYGKSWTLRSWDGFIVPCPFTRCVIKAGVPIRVPPDLDGRELEEWRLKLEEALRDVTGDTDQNFESLFREGMTTREFRRLDPPFPWALEQEQRGRETAGT